MMIKESKPAQKISSASMIIVLNWVPNLGGSLEVFVALRWQDSGYIALSGK